VGILEVGLLRCGGAGWALGAEGPGALIKKLFNMQAQGLGHGFHSGIMMSLALHRIVDYGLANTGTIDVSDLSAIEDDKGVADPIQGITQGQ